MRGGKPGKAADTIFNWIAFNRDRSGRLKVACVERQREQKEAEGKKGKGKSVGWANSRVKLLAVASARDDVSRVEER